MILQGLFMWSSVGRARRGLQAGYTDQNISPESSHACNMNSSLEGCHVFYFKVLCPLCRSVAPSYSTVLYGGWEELKIRGPGLGWSDFKSWLSLEALILWWWPQSFCVCFPIYKVIFWQLDLTQMSAVRTPVLPHSLTPRSPQGGIPGLLTQHPEQLHLHYCLH